jgi:hypothetical protein
MATDPNAVQPTSGIDASGTNAPTTGGTPGSRAGTSGDYGLPTDVTPPWSQRNDPKRNQLAEREQAEAESVRYQAESDGKAYVFYGHRDRPYNNARRIEHGALVIDADGPAVYLTDDEVSALRDQGYEFRAASGAKLEQAEARVAAHRATTQVEAEEAPKRTGGGRKGGGE